MASETKREAPDVVNVRRRVETHRECCGRMLEFQIVDRALRVLDGEPVDAAAYMADRAVIAGLSRAEARLWPARAARRLYAHAPAAEARHAE